MVLSDAAREVRSQAAREVFEYVAREGRIEFGVLSDDEECVLGRGLWPMTDPAAWTRWCALPEAEREARASRALSDLVARSALGPADGGEHPTSIWLGTVLEARTRPAAMLSAPNLSGAADAPTPFLYALADQVGGLRGVVVELRGAGLHEYKLLSLQRAADGMARWAASVAPVVLSVTRHAEHEPLAITSVEVVPGEYGGLALRVADEIVEVALEHDDLAAALGDLLQAAVPPAGPTTPPTR